MWLFSEFRDFIDGKFQRGVAARGNFLTAFTLSVIVVNTEILDDNRNSQYILVFR